MNFEVENIKQEVKIALDQNMSSEQLLDISDIDTLTFDQIIESKIADAARVVLLNAPNHLLDGGSSFGQSISWFSREGLSGGYIVLPNDFLRLVSFQMSDWTRAVTTPISENDPLYELQSSRFPGIRGCPQNPIVALCSQSIGLVLEFYSCTAGAGVTVKKATYIPIPKIISGYISFSEKLKPAIIYYTAYLTALSVGQADLAAVMLNTSKELMQ
jgi:hypothetical protein